MEPSDGEAECGLTDSKAPVMVTAAIISTPSNSVAWVLRDQSLMSGTSMKRYLPTPPLVEGIRGIFHLQDFKSISRMTLDTLTLPERVLRKLSSSELSKNVDKFGLRYLLAFFLDISPS